MCVQTHLINGSRATWPIVWAGVVAMLLAVAPGQPAAAQGTTAAVLRVAAVIPAPRPKPVYKPPIEVAGARLMARLGAGGTVIDEGIDWRIEPLDGGTEAVSDFAFPALELEPGRYRAVATVGEVSAESAFTVPEQGIVDVTVAIEAGKLVVSAKPDAATMPLRRAQLNVYRRGESGDELLMSRTGGELEAIVPSGPYSVEVKAGALSARRELDVATGGTATVALTLEVGTILVDAVAAEGTEPLTDATFVLAEASLDGGGDTLARSTGRRAIFSVGAGEYRLTGRYGLAEVDELVRVPANGFKRVTLTLDAGRLDVEARGPSPDRTSEGPARFRIYDAVRGDAGAPLSEINAQSARIRLPAGRYLIEVRRDGAVLHEEVVLVPGTIVERTMVLNAGAFAPLLAGETGSGPHVQVRFAATALSASGAAALEFPLGDHADAPFAMPAGNYRVTATLLPGGATASQSVTVAAGRRTEARFAFATGVARLELRDKPDGTLVEGTHWVLRDRLAGRTVRVVGGSVDLPVPPGRYDVVAEAGETAASGTVTVLAGATESLRLTLSD